MFFEISSQYSCELVTEVFANRITSLIGTCNMVKLNGKK